jgi:phage terminase large subunit-like protein
MGIDRTTQYAQDVIDGRIIAGPLVRDACLRHFRDLETAESRGFYYDPWEAAEAIAFPEECLKLNGGQFEGKPFILFDWEAFVYGSIYGWLRIPPDCKRVKREIKCEDDEDKNPLMWIDAEGKEVKAFRRFRVVYIETAKGPLALDTPIATVDGWTTMGEIKTGDRVFNSHGKPTTVIGVSSIFHNHDCYKLKFSDGDEIIADAQHEWKISSLRTGRKDGPHYDEKLSDIKRNTEFIYKTFKMAESSSKHPQAKWNHRIDVAPALELPEIDLPLPPYTLGVWLGDGNTDDARVTVAYSDWQIIDEIKKDGVAVNERARQSDTTARVVLGGDRSQKARNKSFQAILRENNLLGYKHIPINYFRSSKAQRLSLLQGFMDTDGHVAKNGHCEITLCNKKLIDDVLELLHTLGFKCVVRESAACLKGKEVGRRWRVVFQAYKSFPPVRLLRKVNNLASRPRTRALSEGRMIVDCIPVPSIPVRCITVDSDDHLFLAGKNLIPTANSGKSPLAASVGIKGLVADDEPRAEIYAAATYQSQAMVLFRDAVAFYDQSPMLKERLIASGVGEKRWNLAYLQTGSFFRVISSERKGQSGPRPHVALLDEIHEHPDGNVIEMLRAGFKWRRQPLSFMITNSGYDVTTVCFEYHEMGRKAVSELILPDSYDEFFAYICSLDPEDFVDAKGNEDDHYLEDESLWPKVNPSLKYGLPGYDYIRQQINEARGLPSKMSTVKRLCFCVWTESESPAISKELWMACQDKDYPEELLIGRRCWGGLDLSAVSDLTALALMFEPGYVEMEKVDGIWKKSDRKWFDQFWRLKVWFWIPKEGIKRKEEIDHVPYINWVENKYVIASPGPAISKSEVVKFIAESPYRDKIVGIAYDRSRMKDLIEFASKAGIELNIGKWDKEKREWKFEGNIGIRMMPFGQEAKSMSPAIEKFELLMTNKTMQHPGNPCLTWNIANTIMIADEDGFRKVSKKKSSGRVDGTTSTVMACGILDDTQKKSIYDGKTKEEIDKMLRGEM